MGKDEKEDSGFGFKDRAKAEETLRLLEQHDANYRRLTVRGLLGRAKRVLSMTKAEEKIKNIKEAMEVFENWLADLDSNKSQKKERKEEKKENKEETRKSSDKREEERDRQRRLQRRQFENTCRMRRQRSQWLRRIMAAEAQSARTITTIGKPNLKAKESDSAELPSESVSGLGFKDVEAAEASLRALEGRDPDYQLLAVKGLLGRAKRVLTCTKDETKLSNIKEAMASLEAFVDEFDNKHMSRQNCPYLSVGFVRTASSLAGEAATDQQKAFLSAYISVNGEYKRLRNVAAEGSTWDVVRNVALKELKEKHADAKLFNEKDEPTKEHLEFLLWAYSPEAARVKKVIKETKEDVPSVASLEIDKEKKREDRKRKSSADDESHSKKKKE